MRDCVSPGQSQGVKGQGQILDISYLNPIRMCQEYIVTHQKESPRRFGYVLMHSAWVLGKVDDPSQGHRAGLKTLL